MNTLDKSLRNQLERTVKDARDIAEVAARASLEQLGVGDASPPLHLSEIERELRRRLRIHGRQLGDARDEKRGTQQLDRLIEEVAYEHWHRMLFARFLAENNLLMYPDPQEPVAISLVECDDLAADEGARNGWELAARYAARMLPQIFRPDSPIFQLTLPPENQQALERMVAILPADVYLASDSLGWVYQFWQSKKKDEVNASEVKIGAREISAVTQLFTEPYMVSFLLDNSLGAWWATRRLTEADLQSAGNEEELRRKAAISGVPLDYLRFVKQGDGTWTPAAGNFDDWPKQLADLKTLDPCCGSGHFLVAAFLMLVPMRIELDGLSTIAAVDAVLRENIHGLELDQRCVELAAFALALTAWKYPNAGGYRALPELNVACSGLSVSVAKDKWKQLGDGKLNLTIALEWMHDTFMDAPVLGSLLNPAKTDAAKLVQWDDLSNALEQALKQEQSEEQQEVAVVAQGLAKAATLLSGRYQLVITNVPYLKSGKQSEVLKAFCETNFTEAKADLATVFLERCLAFCRENGTVSAVLPQNWLFLNSYKSFRKTLLLQNTWKILARLGPGAFDTISGEVVQAILLTISSESCDPTISGHLFNGHNAQNVICGIDVSKCSTAQEKAFRLARQGIEIASQSRQLANEDCRVVFGGDEDLQLLKEFAETAKGVCTYDSQKFITFFWESARILKPFHIPCHSTVERTSMFSGMHSLLHWENGDGELADLMRDKGTYSSGVWKAWARYIGRSGICVSQMGSLPCSLYTGFSFDNNVGLIVPNDLEELAAIWCFCSSPEFNAEARKIDQSLKITNAPMIAVPFDFQKWADAAHRDYPHGLPQPFSDDPTQWIFHGHPCGSVIWDEEQKWIDHGPLRTDYTVLHVAVARLLGYRWPAELDTNIELADAQRQWVKRCEALAIYADDDGIVCIPPVRGEASAADRLLNLTASAYGHRWTNSILADLLKQSDHAGKSLDSWLRNKFFQQHCELFHHRPFIWHIWDGLPDGFAALVNYHKLDRKNLETLTYTYVGDWITRQRQDTASGIDGSEGRLVAAETLKKRLELILEGDAPYDIFVRWKPIHQQPIGWEPELNDGVRLNIRPFLCVPAVKKKGAGILRERPKVDWKKDRGKEPHRSKEEYPWFWGWDEKTADFIGGPEFKGERFNDCHYTLATKRLVRQTQGARD